MTAIVTKKFWITLGVMICLFSSFAKAQDTTKEDNAPPEVVKCGVYITSIHNINFKDKEYNIDMWIWFLYKNQKFDFSQNLELPMAKSVNKSFSTIDTSNGRVYLLMKLQCVMKDMWRINNFPFDHQFLRFSVENSQFDSTSLVFEVDTLGKHFDPRFALQGWRIDSLNISTGTKLYESAFGDPTQTIPHSVYSTYKVKLQIDRDAMGLFWKMFLGMYIAFLIAWMCFYIHPDSIDARFGLSVGALFAVVGNKYIVDSSLPESSTFTLVDTLHGVTLFFILLVMTSTAYTLKLVTQKKEDKAKKIDRMLAKIVMAIYLLINAFFIYRANHA